jgi:hypothetical protein
MQVFIDTLHILKSDLLPQHHLVEGTDEERIQEATVENSKADHPANELEVVEMLRVDPRVGINLQGIIIVGGVFEETVEGIEHFVREEEEEFTAELLVSMVRTQSVEHTEKDRRSPGRLRRRT